MSESTSNNDANQLAYGACPDCSAPLHIKHVGKSSFLGCSAYPNCEYSHSLQQHEVVTIKIMDNSCCPLCACELAVKKGRYGMFIGCTNFPQCDFISNKKDIKTTDTYEPVLCPSCKKGALQKKQNRFGKFFYACDAYPKCKHIENLQPINNKCTNCESTVMLVKNKNENTVICANKECLNIENAQQKSD